MPEEKKYYSLIVSETFDPFGKDLYMSKRQIFYPKEFTDPRIMRWLHKLQWPEMEHIRTFPTLFTKPVSKIGDAFQRDSRLYIGNVTDAKEFDFAFKISYTCRPLAGMEEISSILPEIGIDTRPYRMEIDYVHWAVKQIDLKTVLGSHGIDIG